MPAFIGNIWKFIISLKPKHWIYIGGVIILLLFLKQCNTISNLKTDLQLEEQNRISMLDTMEIIKSDKAGLIAFKTTAVADKKKLKEINEDLLDELDNLKKKGVKGDIKTISRIKGNISPPNDQPLEAEVVYINPEGEVRLTLNLDTIYDENNSRHLAGYVDFYIDSMKVKDVRAILTEDEINIALSTGIVKMEDGIYKIYVQSDYPGFNVTDLDGAILDKKMLKELGLTEASWVIGPQVGYGYPYSGEKASPYVGVGVTYNLNKEVKKIFRKK